MLHGEHKSYFSGSSYYHSSDITIDQRTLLPSFGRYDYSVDMITPPNITEEGFNRAFYLPFELRENQRNQNLSLVTSRKNEFWETKNNLNNVDVFKLKFSFTVVENVLTYKTEALELLKWFWIQALAVYVVIDYIFGSLTAIFIENGVFGTMVKFDKTKFE